MNKFVVCYSGGHSSALCAIEAVRKYGNENIILLNHDINPKIEAADIKRFKNSIANYLDLKITYANHKDWQTATPVSVSVAGQGWKFKSGPILCTSKLKTKPFKKWQEENDQEKQYTYIYGFDLSPKERERARRRSQIMGLEGYKTAFPLINWQRTIQSTEEIGIKPPMTYGKFIHANCSGCLKAGWQHWFIVYCERSDIWEEAKAGEDEIGYSIHKDDNGPVYLEDKEPLFKAMKAAGVEPTEHIKQQRFWADAKRKVKEAEQAREIAELEKHDQGVCLDCTV